MNDISQKLAKEGWEKLTGEKFLKHLTFSSWLLLSLEIKRKSNITRDEFDELIKSDLGLNFEELENSTQEFEEIIRVVTKDAEEYIKTVCGGFVC